MKKPTISGFCLAVTNHTPTYVLCLMGNNNDQKDDIIKQLAIRIKQLRKAKGHKNYEYFAYENNISRTQYGKYEQGVDIRFSSLVRIVKAFDMTLEEFFSEGFEIEKD